jgi:hypothetical protein
MGIFFITSQRHQVDRSNLLFDNASKLIFKMYTVAAWTYFKYQPGSKALAMAATASTRMATDSH